MAVEKISAEEFQRLVDDVDELMLQGYDINVAYKLAGGPIGQKCKVLTAVKHKRKVWLKNSADDDKAEMLTMYMNLFQKSYSLGNYKLCKSIMDSISEIKKVKENAVTVKSDYDIEWS